MKKILLLGGGPQQIIAINTAKRLGYYTIICDYLPDNPGQFVADKYYPVSTTDINVVYEIAKSESIDGIIAYASDPAAPTAAYIAEQLNLPGNSYNTVNTACNKGLFRNFLKDNGFNVPHHQEYSDINTAVDLIDNLEFPVVIKPVDSSGSKGVTVVRDKSSAKKAILFAFDRSRSRNIIIEKYIERKHKHIIGGDIFVMNGKIVVWGLMNCYRDERVNPLVPVGKSYPVELNEQDLDRAKSTLQDMVDKLHFESGPMNVELMIDANDDVWLIDIGPRAGGNMIPDLMQMIFGVDLVEMSVRLAMGDKPDIKIRGSGEYYATHNIHSVKDGRFKRVKYDETVSKYIIKECIYVKHGEEIDRFTDSSCVLGIVFMKFEDKDQLTCIMDKINEHITVELM